MELDDRQDRKGQESDKRDYEKHKPDTGESESNCSRTRCAYKKRSTLASDPLGGHEGNACLQGQRPFPSRGTSDGPRASSILEALEFRFDFRRMVGNEI